MARRAAAGRPRAQGFCAEAQRGDGRAGRALDADQRKPPRHEVVVREGAKDCHRQGRHRSRSQDSSSDRGIAAVSKRALVLGLVLVL